MKIKVTKVFDLDIDPEDEEDSELFGLEGNETEDDILQAVEEFFEQEQEEGEHFAFEVASVERSGEDDYQDPDFT